MNTTTTTAVCEQPAVRAGFFSAGLARLSDYLELTKPRIAILELVTVAVAAFLAKGASLDLALLGQAVVGTGLVAASASIFNQLIERRSDAQMPRTAARPLPAGRVTRGEAIVLGGGTLILGGWVLVALVNVPTAAVGLLSWVLYVLVYTPLKSRTSANTPVGAVAGALPVLMGWLATGAPLDFRAATLFLIVYLWQFPHFMAIAWLYRNQYAAAGMRMLTVVDGSGLRAGLQAVLAALILIPVSLTPAVSPWAGSAAICFAGALLLGVAQLAFAIAFCRRRSDASAGRLLMASLVYLPSLLILLMLSAPV
jgi:protoheme IX farnesyltransferase